MALELLVIVVSYLLGSVSFSVLLAKLLKGIDIRQYGSGNAGATNTLRVLGKGPAILVLLLDVLKGVAAVWLGTWVGGWGTWVPALCGIAAIIGHNWPLYFRFRGGKGIATTIGVMATLCLWPALLSRYHRHPVYLYHTLRVPWLINFCSTDTSGFIVDRIYTTCALDQYYYCGLRLLAAPDEYCKDRRRP